MAPRSPAFLAYATGERAASLLSVSPQWWRTRQPAGARPGIGRRPGRRNGAARSGDRRRRADRGHRRSGGGPHPRAAEADLRESAFLAGPPRTLEGGPAAAQEARRIARAIAPVFRRLGYRLDPDRHLDGSRADENWVRLWPRWPDQPSLGTGPSGGVVPAASIGGLRATEGLKGRVAGNAYAGFLFRCGYCWRIRPGHQTPRIRLPAVLHIPHLLARRPSMGIRRQYPLLCRPGTTGSAIFVVSGLPPCPR